VGMFTIYTPIPPSRGQQNTVLRWKINTIICLMKASTFHNRISNVQFNATIDSNAGLHRKVWIDRIISLL
jgi:hypothetical protein